MRHPRVLASGYFHPRQLPGSRSLKLLFAVAVLVTIGRGVSFAIECGSTGNVYWTYNLTNSQPGARTVALDSTRVYWSVGSAMVQLSRDGGLIDTRDFLSMSLGRPLVVDTQHGVTDKICVATSTGYVYALDPDAPGLPALWSRNLRRVSCNSDGLHTTLALQLWDLSDATYRAAQNTDLVVAGTRHACSSSTANKVYALDGANGDIRWTFNATGGYFVEPVTGLALDYANNIVYVTTEKSDPGRSQVTVFALRTTNGTRLWGMDLGHVAARPLLADGALYVVDYDGLLSRLNPATGATVWSLQVTTGGQVVTLDMGYSSIMQRLFLTATGTTGSDGVIVAVDDLGSSGQVAWQTSASGPGSLGAVTTAPEVLDDGHVVYAGVSYGGVVQLGVCQGYLQHEEMGPSNVDDLVADTLNPAQPRLYAATMTNSVSKLCIPWPADAPGGDPDADDDGVIDCLDGCPNDPLKTDPGLCGCGVPDVGDCAPPEVTVTGPNGGESVTISTQAPLTWTASDNVGVTAVDLRLSRDGGASFETIALGEPNDGTFDWTVTGPPTTQARIEVTAHDAAGGSGADLSDANWSILPTPTGVGDRIPTRDALYGAVPNPFNPATRIRYDLASHVQVSLDVYDVAGQRIKRLVDLAAGPGQFVTQWDGTNENGERVSTGVYFCRLTAGPYLEVRKMVLLK